MEFHKSYHIQRLTVPHTPKKPERQWKLDQEGKFTEDAVSLRKGVFEYDYMGSSEFEFGAIPRAVKEMIKKQDRLISFKIIVLGQNIERDILTGKRYDDCSFFAICDVQQLTDVERNIRAVLSGEQRLKESLHLHNALGKDKGKPGSIGGWFEVDNGYYFFIDQVMWTGTTFLYNTDT